MLLAISLKAEDTVRYNPGAWVFEYECFLDSNGTVRNGVMPREQDQKEFIYKAKFK